MAFADGTPNDQGACVRPGQRADSTGSARESQEQDGKKKRMRHEERGRLKRPGGLGWAGMILGCEDGAVVVGAPVRLADPQCGNPAELETGARVSQLGDSRCCRGGGLLSVQSC